MESLDEVTTTFRRVDEATTVPGRSEGLNETTTGLKVTAASGRLWWL